MLIRKICNKVYVQYLGFFCKTIALEKNAIVDCRCEIEQKNNITIGKNSIFYKNITLYKNKEGHFSMGSFSHIAPYGYLLIEKQNLHIGNNVAIGPYCSIFCSTNTIPEDKNILFKDSYLKGDIKIGNNVLIGTHCVVLPHTTIEDNVVIAANSTVKGKLQSGFLYGGNPAIIIKALENE